MKNAGQPPGNVRPKAGLQVMVQRAGRADQAVLTSGDDPGGLARQPFVRSVATEGRMFIPTLDRVRLAHGAVSEVSSRRCTACRSVAGMKYKRVQFVGTVACSCVSASRRLSRSMIIS